MPRKRHPVSVVALFALLMGLLGTVAFADVTCGTCPKCDGKVCLIEDSNGNITGWIAEHCCGYSS